MDEELPLAGGSDAGGHSYGRSANQLLRSRRKSADPLRLLLQAQAITGHAEHFGLGEWTETDVARILWPNGVVNAEFALQADQEVQAQQRLKGSCPFLFAWDGKEMRFVKDTVPWGSAIGLRINDLGSARIAATEEWYKIPREDLVSRDGAYDLSITGELWETYYYDWLGLMTVDHPQGPRSLWMSVSSFLR